MPRYVKKRLIDFHEKGEIEILTNIDSYLSNCKTLRDKIALLLLFLTGARPSEIVELKAGDVYKQGHFCIVHITTKKGGRTRDIYLPRHGKGRIPFYTNLLLDLIDEHYVDEMKLLWGWKPYTVRDRIYSITNGELAPYFFRHNFMSLNSKLGRTLQELKYLKGAKTIASVEPYVHISADVHKKIARGLAKV